MAYDDSMNRREMLKNSAYVAALFGLPGSTTAAAPPSLPPDSLFDRDPKAYWTRLREEQFLLPGWRAFLQNGSLGIAPKPVVAAVTDYLNRSAALDLEEYPRWGYETLDDHRTAMAAYLGCKKDELAFQHNATEALSTIAAGIDLSAGDEVIMTDMEHPSGTSGWQMRQARHGIQVRQVKLPMPPKTPDELADRMISAIGPRTKVIFFSGIISGTGWIMPVRQICDAARAKGVISVVDGAHMNGQIPLRLSELGCDYYAGSPHKWMFAPAGSGILYIREENLDKLWPLAVTGGWDQKQLKAARFQMFGTNNRAIVEGTMAALRFSQQLGPDRIYTRIHQLAKMTYQRAAERRTIELLSPEDDKMYGSIVTIRLKSKEHAAALGEACKKKRIWVLQGPQIRLSLHIHTRPSDIDLFFKTLDETAV